MAYVGLTILCSTAIALILKWNDALKASAIYLLLGNYLVAAAISLFFWKNTPGQPASWQSLVLGLPLGGLFVFSFFAFTKAVAASGASLATVSARLSVAIPVLLSMVLFDELPGFWQTVGLALVALTLWFFYQSLKNRQTRAIHWPDFFYLFVLWLGIGINDFSLKIFQNWRGVSEKSFFLLVIFGSAFIYTFLIVYVQNIKLDRAAFTLGLALGIPNMFSAFFMINALHALPGVIVYPTVNLGIILLTTLGSYIIWNEKLNSAGLQALLSGSLAILFLNL
ncbi:protein of unknown function DUF6 transmembrane [Caldithrix abyssi DSM 13497]|uniref:EamA-like transporter family protein n=1 Tax=Caldithrix abyssi DSM 13497 TaxID=880073 RepID=H1XU03_CALAY|nr:hypothetical protein [Caldithrix abyssi]APF16906.1 hypothetical protein Cabys_155 [Caldithrix abyssi DSM 13497]EHO40446.1 protein of unknown function DUF6 transmembrane [Caldithrix abyssi DSM 13497]